MTFAAPVFAWIGGVAAAAVIGLHLLAWRRPPETPLPTARFAPERPIRMVSRALRPADLLLLALRVALVLLIGFALAGPRFEQRRTGSARVVVVDRSSAVRAGGDAVAAARRELRTSGDALVVFDSSAREIEVASLDSVAGKPSNTPGSLSAALIAATRAARRLQKLHDTVEIVVVSPFAHNEIDAATSSIRSLWAGSMRRVRVASAVDSVGPSAVPLSRDDPNDGVLAAVTLNGAVAGGGRIRVVRDSLLASDSAAAREGGTIVAWPRSGSGRWSSRASVDTAMAVTASDRSAGSRNENATVVAPFQRAWNPPDGRVVARWADGEPAATETPLGAGCVRSVAIDVPSTGDLALTPSFRRFARSMTAPCGTGTVAALSDTALDRALPPTVDRSQASIVSSAAEMGTSPLKAWLLALAIAAMVAEQMVRRRGDHASA